MDIIDGFYVRAMLCVKTQRANTQQWTTKMQCQKHQIPKPNEQNSSVDNENTMCKNKRPRTPRAEAEKQCAEKSRQCTPKTTPCNTKRSAATCVALWSHHGRVCATQQETIDGDQTLDADQYKTRKTNILHFHGTNYKTNS